MISKKSFITMLQCKFSRRASRSVLSFYILLLLGFNIFLFSNVVVGAAPEVESISYADAAIILAKYYGFFGDRINATSSLEECVVVLNRSGIYFGMMEVVSGKKFEKKDCARVFGQLELLLRGDAEFDMGIIKLPKGVARWENFCMLNAIDFDAGYESMISARKRLPN